MPGWCVRCGYFYDLYGMRLLDPTVKCKVHSPIKASCPHSGSLAPPAPGDNYVAGDCSD